VRETFRWVLTPAQDADPGRPLSKLFWEEEPVPGGTHNLTETIQRVLEENELLITRWSPIHLANLLKAWYWKGGSSEVNALHVWQQSCNYPYMPRLLESRVFEAAVAEGVKSRDFFGFATGKDGEKYLGLVFDRAGSVYLDDSGLLVEREAAKGQVDAVRDEAAIAGGTDAGVGKGYQGPGGGGSDIGADTGAGVQGDGGTQKPAAPTRFYATVELDPVKASMDFAQIMNEVVQNFSAKIGSRVTISVEINASLPAGFDEQTQRIVRENCRTLKFKSFEFDE